jgi:hypothetical protein
MPADDDFPKWDNSDPEASLDRVYQWAVAKTQAHIDWYDKNRRPTRRWSRVLRFSAIALATAGALCPLLDAAGLPAAIGGGVALGQWGYVLLALAAGVFAFDKYFGMSTGWMRFIVTQMSIERALREFQCDWAIMHAKQGEQEPREINVPAMLQRIRDFVAQVEGLMKQETDAWVVEFQSNITELNKLLKAKVEKKRLGGIKVRITNAAEFPKVALFLDDIRARELVGVSEGLIDRLPPRRYEVKATGEKGGREYNESMVVEVQPDSMASAELTLR